MTITYIRISNPPPILLDPLLTNPAPRLSKTLATSISISEEMNEAFRDIYKANQAAILNTSSSTLIPQLDSITRVNLPIDPLLQGLPLSAQAASIHNKVL